eukprot:CAMPEP_0117446362 /NCGR_PEP_ID=MMETSP0759-20121206/6299_1 /TAXON_ID=63605 /ORGANISM="Percolomonas cosmopolitus, Strain WS" /LENGTH=422 /DNA_ID=CAMNT_0005238621 /DNA_START=283 /DNA_END=1551 /DNA_ORIENTATION=+
MSSSSGPPPSPTSTSSESDEFVFEGQAALNDIIKGPNGMTDLHGRDFEEEFGIEHDEFDELGVHQEPVSGDGGIKQFDEDLNSGNTCMEAQMKHEDEFGIVDGDEHMRDDDPSPSQIPLDSQQGLNDESSNSQHEQPTKLSPTQQQPDLSQNTLAQTRLQWDQVNQLRAQQGYGAESSGQMRKTSPEEAPIRSTDAYALLQQNDSNFKQHVKTIEEQSEDGPNLMQWISKFTFGACGATPIRSKSLMQQRKELFATCKVQLDLADETHIRIMGTIYKRLTGDRYNCPMVGSHWERLGFQRPNPQTDLRDAGMFGIQTKEQDFPFCVVSLNMTGIAKGLLRTGKLNPLINKKRDVLDAMNLAYMSIFYDFYLTWKTGKTIHQYGSIKKALEAKSMRNVEKLVSVFEREVLGGPFHGVPKQEFD